MTTKRAGNSSGNYSRDPVVGEANVHVSEKLLQRLPTTKGRITALREVHEKLATATVLYREHGDGGRRGVFQAVVDVMDYLASQGIPRAALEPLSAVAAAVVDADNGAQNPIFKPDRKGGGKPRRRSDKLAAEGYLAVVMECCVLHCKAQGFRPYIREAGTMAARLVNNSSWPTKVNPTQLREIRERVMQSNSASPDRALFEQSMSSKVAKVEPLEWAKALLTHEWVSFPPG